MRWAVAALALLAVVVSAAPYTDPVGVFYTRCIDYPLDPIATPTAKVVMTLTRGGVAGVVGEDVSVEFKVAFYALSSSCDAASLYGTFVSVGVANTTTSIVTPLNCIDATDNATISDCVGTNTRYTSKQATFTAGDGIAFFNLKCPGYAPTANITFDVSGGCEALGVKNTSACPIEYDLLQTIDTQAAVYVGKRERSGIFDEPNVCAADGIGRPKFLNPSVTLALDPLDYPPPATLPPTTQPPTTQPPTTKPPPSATPTAGASTTAVSRTALALAAVWAAAVIAAA